ncbi:hypothetical protein BGW80DRAFT_1445400 [Lactifluus volemus]|nr:hypothetical protein BGW80DRAFT_1445400 [Lactifluus volemus]
MNIIQYTTYALRGNFPLKIHIPAESKWQSDCVRGLPKLQRVVTLMGMMPKLPVAGDSKEDIFCIHVTRDLEYVGYTSPNPQPQTAAPPLDTSTFAAGTGGLQFMQQLHTPIWFSDTGPSCC